MFKTYKASAGAGKTTNLVAEYLSICLTDLEKYRHVLAITFTNNATAEMKSRIVQTLNCFSTQSYLELQGSNKAVFDRVIELSSLTHEEVRNRSSKLLEKILFDYQNFSISTIDSFFQRILRSFAYELHLNMNYSVEISLDDYYSQTIDTLFNKISSSEPELSRRVLNLVEEQMDKSGRWSVDQKLLHFLRMICDDEESSEPLAVLTAYQSDMDTILSSMKQKIMELEDKLSHVIGEGRKLIAEAGFESTAYIGRGYGIHKWFEKATVSSLPNYAALAAAAQDGTSFLKADYASRLIDEDARALYHQARAIYADCKKMEIFHRNMHNLQLLYDLKDIIDQIRERDNKFFLASTNYTIHSEIKDVDTPYLYEKVGSRYSFFFIDEFQDTSKMQWENMLPLIKESLSNGQKSILFGDMKQAIYRFRNGDAQLFKELTSAESEEMRIFEHENCSLSTNYRSYGRIIEFNNRFFANIASYDGFPRSTVGEEYAAYYADVEQKSNPENGELGYVCVEFFNPTEEVPTMGDFLNVKVWWAVQDALACGYQYKDIAILSRSNAVGSAMGRMLASHSVPVISSDSLLLTSSDEVNLIISFLRYLVDCEDDLAKVKIVQCLLRVKNNPTPLAELLPCFIRPKQKKQVEITEAQLAQDKQNFLQLLETHFHIHFVWKDFEHIPLFTLVNKVIAVMALNEENAFVVSLLDYLLDYLEKSNGEVAVFLEWWDKKKNSLSISSPENINAVRISTIHKSKGLEYPVVIIPAPTTKIRRTKNTFWYKTQNEECALPYVLLNINKDLETVGGNFAKVLEKSNQLDYMDVVNVMYVAQTRPKKAMYLLVDQLEDKTPEQIESLSKSSFAYQYMLNSFIHPAANGELAEGFERDSENTFRYWFHGENHRLAPVAESYPEQADISPAMLPIHDFVLGELSHFNGGGEVSQEQSVGNAVHDFLARLKQFPQSADEVANFQFDEQQAYPEEIRSALLTLVNNASYKRYFQPDVAVLNEVSILENSAEIVAEGMESQLIYRPDRVVLFENETVVLDYKTGNPGENAKRKYEAQIEKYVDLLRKMNFPNVRGELIYL